MPYPSFQWKYVSKKPKLRFVVFAREQKTADEIIAIENTRNSYYLRPKRFGFKKAVMAIKPPYELEQHEIQAAEKRLKRRDAYYAEHPEEKCQIVAKDD